MIPGTRFDRNVAFFGSDGQEKIGAIRVAIVGVGGVGSHVVQQLAYLGVGTIIVIDNDGLEETNLNRLIGARHSDPVPGTKKVDIMERMVMEINPSIRVSKIYNTVISQEAVDGIMEFDYLFCCVDNDGPRLFLIELCTRYEISMIDVTTEIIPGEKTDYGGEIFFMTNGEGCLHCCGLIDPVEAREYFNTEEQNTDRDNIYGVSHENLGGSGPSVVMLNGVIASLAVTEFVVAVTGLREPNRHMRYDGRSGKVFVRDDQANPNCYYCKGIRGQKDGFDLDQYLR